MTTLCFVFGRTQAAPSFFVRFSEQTGILRVFLWGQNAF